MSDTPLGVFCATDIVNAGFCLSTINGDWYVSDAPMGNNNNGDHIARSVKETPTLTEKGRAIVIIHSYNAHSLIPGTAP